MPPRAAKPNPFDLSRKAAGPPAPAAARTWTDEDIADRLRGYLEIPAPFWENLKFNTHVRYFLKSDGGFRPGGFIEKGVQDVAAPNNEPGTHRVMRLRNGFDSKAISWAVAYDDIDKLYAKLDAVELTLLQIQEEVVARLNENIRKLAEHAKRLERRLEGAA